MARIALPTKDRTLESYSTGEPIVFPSSAETRRFNRIAYAAAHIVADPLADIDPWEDAAVDWEKTIAFRHYLWDLGLGVAEAMDTAQRGGGLDWAGAKQLIGYALDAAKSRPGVNVCCGVGTDHLAPGADVGIDDIIRAYEEQIEAIEAMGGKLVVMASRALARAAKSPLITRASTAASCVRLENRSSSIGSARCSTRRSPVTGARWIMRRRWKPASASSATMRQRSTA